MEFDMRFSWLFLGYLFMLSFPFGEISALPVLGYALMLFASLRLSRFEEKLVPFKYVLYAAVPIGAALLAIQIYLSGAGDGAFTGSDVLYEVIQWADELIEMLAMFFLYIGVKRIGEKAEYPTLEKQATRNMAIMIVYLLFEVTVSVLRRLAPGLFTNFEVIFIYPFIIGLIWRALNLWMLFKCYVGIASADEEENEHKSKRQSRREAEEAELRSIRAEIAKNKNTKGNDKRNGGKKAK